MSNSIYLARLIGPVAITGGVGVLLDRTAFRAMAAAFIASPPLIFLSGLLTMTAGVATVLHHNLWVSDWRVLITVFGWLAAIGGATRIAVPAHVATVGNSLLDQAWVGTLSGLVWLTVGLLLCFFGYVR